MTFSGLFRTVATAAGPRPGAELTPAQRLGAISTAIAERRGTSARSGARPRGPASPRASSACSTSSRAPGSSRRTSRRQPRPSRAPPTCRRRGAVRRLRRGPRPARDGRQLRRSPARRSRCCAESGGFWGERPVFLYGLDDLTRNQLDLVRALAAATEVTVALPYEERQPRARGAAGAARASCARSGSTRRPRPRPDPGNTPSPLLFHLERSFGAAEPERMAPDDEPRPPALRRRARRGRGDRRRGRHACSPRHRPGRDRDRPPRPVAARRRCSRRCSSPTGSRSRSRPRCRSQRPRSAAR